VKPKDLDENAAFGVDAAGNVCAITFEHASTRTDVRSVTPGVIAA
jgi:uncharacterized protein YuzE